MTEPESGETLQAFLRSLQAGETRTGRVTSVEESEVLVDLDGVAGPHRAVGSISLDELSWKRFNHPSEIVAVNQEVVVEVIGVDWPQKRVWLSSKACEDRALRSFLGSVQRGEIRTGVVARIEEFGVFVDLDGEPAHRCTGFITIPELSWVRVEHASDIVELGQRVTAEILAVDTRRGQVSLSLKSLQLDPLSRLVDRVGQVASGRVTKLVPFGAFVRIADGVEGLVHLSELSDEPVDNPEQVVREGDEISVRILEVDLEKRRVALSVKQVS